MDEPDFSDLVHEAEQLATEIEGTGELPKIERSLRQILEASQALWSRVTVSGAQDIQANLLLGTRGLDLPQITQKLQSLSARKTFEPLDPIPLTDIQSYLKNERENAILQLIESTHHATFNSIENLHKVKLAEEWNEQKTNLMNSLLGYSKQIIDVPLRTEKTVINDTLFGNQSALNQEEMAYAKCLMDYNTAVLQGHTKPDLLEAFSQAAEAFNNQKLNEMWKMLKFMTQIPPQAKGDSLQSRATPATQERMIHQALAYLEDRYRIYINSVVSGNLSTARRGGIPGTYSLVRGFVGIRVSQVEGLEDVNIDGLPLWPLVYYCLRCGDVPSALMSCKLAGISLEEICMFLEDLRDSPNRKLSMRMELQARSTYRRIVRSSTDPYKRAVYCVLGACDIHDDHRDIAVTADDYLWIKLWQVREEEPDPVPDRIHYSLLQSLVLEEYGESHYRASEQPQIYFQMLVLTGQWESAFDFLVRIDKFRSHAVHMAIALHELDLLALPASVNSPLLVIDEVDKVPMRRLNILRLILLYTRKFEINDPKETLHYYFILRNLETKDGKNAFASCVCNLVVETKQFDIILGHLLPDGCRAPGLLDAFNNYQINTKSIISDIALTAEKKGQQEDAVKLYDLSGSHEKVLSLMSVLLSQIVAKKSSEKNALRNRLTQTATSIASRYEGIELDCSKLTLSTFHTFRDLIVFFDMYHTKQYNKAIEVIQKTKLIPFTTEEIDERVANFRSLDESICRNIPDVLLATMHIYHNQYIQAQ
ncbi:hypothetical protein AAG570_001942 [Ranatra chinensis]|uniref:Nuclear pore protein n=1 Tax=Ranatra chinensis TaxID=642074 RepID=A0ABD0YA88_9HEMI